MPPLVPTLKALRSMPGPNGILTSGLRAILSAVDRESEFLIKHLPRSGQVRCELPDGQTLTMLTRGDDWIPNLLFWRGFAGYEPEMAPLFFALAHEAAVTIDVGAFVGYYTLLAGLANESGRVLAFEPFEPLRRRLETNVGANRLQNVTSLPLAAGDRNGSVPFFHREGNETPSSSSLSFEFMDNSPDSTPLLSTDVNVATVDAVVAEHGAAPVGLVKIDTESTEPAVIRGLKTTIARDRPHIFCEVLPQTAQLDDVEAVLAPHGYHYYVLTAGGPIERCGIAPTEAGSNQLFTALGPEALAEKMPLGRRRS